ncbi:MAG: DUF2127 domain-containing protein [Opitutae bacterium]|nr:DUF2127 domain-containing protein [Opitutae bacterium]
MPAPSHKKGLRVVAALEAFKGAIVLVVGFGFLTLLGRDQAAFAEHLVARLHLNPAHHYPHIFIEAMSNLNDTHLLALAGLAAAYSALRFAEAYGLWLQRRWAEWLAALSGAIYVPVEVYEIFHRASWFKIVALVVNLVIVGYMVWLLTESRRLAAHERATASPHA